jgi:predicted nucleotidyltransferase
VLSDAKALYDQIAALDLGELVAGWIDDFEKKWNDDGIMKRWHFRGWVMGYAIMEVVLLVVSFGAVTGAKWAGKAAKLAKAITSLPRVQKTIKAVQSIKVPPKLKEGLSKVFKGGDKLEDIAKLKQKLLSKLSQEAKLAVEALPDDQIAKIAKLYDGSPDAVDDILRGYYHKVVKKGEDVSDAARYVDDSLKAMKVTQGRGFPYGFADLQKFEEFKAKIVAALQRYGIPHDDVAVHGSSVIRKTPNDIDVAVLVDKAKFDEIVRGIEASTDKAKILKQLRTEAPKGKIPSFLFVRKFPGSSFGSEIYGSAGKIKVQVSLIQKGGAFDIGPYIKF